MKTLEQVGQKESQHHCIQVRESYTRDPALNGGSGALPGGGRLSLLGPEDCTL